MSDLFRPCNDLKPIKFVALHGVDARSRRDPDLKSSQTHEFLRARILKFGQVLLRNQNKHLRHTRDLRCSCTPALARCPYAERLTSTDTTTRTRSRGGPGGRRLNDWIRRPRSSHPSRPQSSERGWVWRFGVARGGQGFDIGGV